MKRLLFILLLSFSFTATLLVPEEYSQIRFAIEASIEGDTILVSSGMYPAPNINIEKSISIIGEDMQSTFLYCDYDLYSNSYCGNTDIVKITDGENVLLKNFTITMGNYGYEGVAIRIESNSMVTLDSLYLYDNRSYDSAIRIENGNVKILNSIISDNGTFGSGDGGAIHTRNSNVEIINTQINTNNAYSGSGGAIYANNSNIIINNSSISNNSASSEGGGIYAENTFLEINNSSITGNQSDTGSALNVTVNSDALIQNSIIKDNYADGIGGSTAIRVANSSNLDINKTLIYNNEGLYGAIHFSESGGNIDKSTIISNSEYTDIYVENIPVNINNSIINVDKIHLMSPSIFNYSLINSSFTFGNNGDEYITNSCILNTDPLFTNSNQDDYTLQSTSPCIDAGDPNSELDPDGTRADMGAYYYHQTSGCADSLACNYDQDATIDDGSCEYNSGTWYVSLDGDDANCGSEDQPLANIQSAIDASSDGDTILVSAGTYYENITVPTNLHIIGEDKETTIIDGNQSGSVIVAYNSFNIEGFTIQNGNYTFGGGIRNGSDNNEGFANVNLKNLIFKNNYGNTGGAIYYYTSQNSVFDNIVVKDNSCSSSAVYMAYNSSYFYNSEISYNGCSGIVSYYSNINLLNCTISENIGKGIINYNGYPSLRNCILYGDSSGEIENYGSLMAYYSNIQAGSAQDYWFGEGCISELPMFVNQPEGNYNLQPTSPCIDAGDPNSELDPDGTRADMGAYYFHQTSGCTAPEAFNYNEEATIDDGSCEYIPGEFNLLTPEDGSIITFDESSYFTTFVDFSWEESQDLNLDDLISYNLNIVDLSTGQTVLNVTTNQLNFAGVTMAGLLLYDQNSPVNEEIAFNWTVTATDNSDFEYSTTCIASFDFSLYYEEPILGDINGDFELNVQDIIVIIDLILAPGYPADYYEIADMNQDGVLNIYDIIFIINIILGN